MNDIHIPALRAGFHAALRLAGATRPDDTVFDELVARYSEPHRHYHNLEHVAACLAWLDRCANLSQHPENVSLAIWFHDAIYDPRATDNEQRSAQLARSHLRGLGVPAAATDRIATHILATQHHDAVLGDTRLVVDIDLTILGAPPSAFAKFEQRIRREYVHVPNAAFIVGRRAVLQEFLRRPVIYHTPEIRESLEVAARSNLEQRIAELSRSRS